MFVLLIKKTEVVTVILDINISIFIRLYTW